MSLHLAILLILGMVSIFLGSLVLMKEPKNKANRLFFVFALVVLIWILTNYLVDHPIWSNLALFWNRLNFSSAISMSVVLLFFSFVFPIENFRHNAARSVILIFSLVLLLLILLTDLGIKDIEFKSWGTNALSGPLFSLGIIWSIACVVGIVVNIIYKYRRAGISEKMQIKFLFYGVILSAMLGLINSGILPLLTGSYENAKYTPYTMFFLLSFAAYAIIRHHLMEIRVIATEGMVSAIVLILFIQALLSKTVFEGLLRGGFLLIVIYFSYLLIKSVIKEISQRKEVERLAKEKTQAFDELDERNRNLQALQKLSNIVLNNIELQPMTQEIIDRIPKEVSNCAGALVVMADNDRQTLKGFVISNIPELPRIKRMLKKDVTEFSQSINGEHSLAIQAFKEQAAQRSNNLGDFITPAVSRSTAYLVQEFAGIHGVFAVPLSAGHDHFGVLIFTLKIPMEKIHSEDINMMVAIGDEVSLAIQRAMAYDELKKANEYLKQLDLMKDEFISMASHELNTPLAAIEGYLSMILDEHMGKVDKTANEYLHRVYDSSKRLAALILDLLNVSRIEQGRIHLIYTKNKIADLITSVIKELSIKAKPKKLTLKFEPTKPALPEIWIDSNRIREVLVNIIGNAIKFSDKGDIIIEAKADDQYITVSIQDAGCGINKEDIDKLFKKFSQINRDKTEVQGTGLGLYISRNFVELHHGKVWVESPPAGATKGSKFFFTLPIIKDKPRDPYEDEGEVLRSEKKEKITEVIHAE